MNLYVTPSYGPPEAMKQQLPQATLLNGQSYRSMIEQMKQEKCSDIAMRFTEKYQTLNGR